MFIIIRRVDKKIYLENEKGINSHWGPRMKHKGTNIFNLANELLGNLNEMKIPYNGDTMYVVHQPDLFLISELGKWKTL